MLSNWTHCSYYYLCAQ